jgi:hypothetical protein
LPTHRRHPACWIALPKAAPRIRQPVRLTTEYGRSAFPMIQSAVLDASVGSGKLKRMCLRHAQGKAAAQYAYRMDGCPQGRGISALVVINERELLVPQRDNRGLRVDKS